MWQAYLPASLYKRLGTEKKLYLLLDHRSDSCLDEHVEIHFGGIAQGNYFLRRNISN